MYLTRAEIAWSAARNPYDHHRRIWRLFPGQSPEARSTSEETRQGFLYRVEHAPVGRAARVLVQSRFGPEAGEGIRLIATRRFDPRPTPGQSLAFVLTANPVKTITDDQLGAKPGKRSQKCRVPLIHEDQQLAWLERKLDGAAKLQVATLVPQHPIYFRRGSRGGKVVPVTFEGRLVVLDGDALRHLLANGVGPAKALGCGLLMVRRLADGE